MTPEERLAALLDDASSRGVKIMDKAGVWHQRLADRFLRVVWLGRMKTYMDGYVTTFGRAIYVPSDFSQWPALRRWQTLRHELVHVEQYRRYGWVLMVIVYGLLPLPIGLAYGRARLEWEAYEETLRAVFVSEGRDAAHAPKLRMEIVRRFTGPDYLWMWPFRSHVNRWIDSALSHF
ncbi:MAG: hypothetical protein IT381_04565 [Deltaproteobacteria bacterium]|nr:hypothetical protein [Deltaproteobacteria bacterium]